MNHRYTIHLNDYEVSIIVSLFAKPMNTAELRKVTGLPSYRLKEILRRLKEKGVIGYELNTNINPS